MNTTALRSLTAPQGTRSERIPGNKNKEETMKQRLYPFRLLALAAVALVMSSCLRDSLDDCPPPYNVQLIVKTDYEKEHPAATPDTRGAAGPGWYQDQIENVSVYVFDEDDRFVTLWTGPRYTMYEDYVVPFCLEEGKSYRFVAWTNSSGGIYTPSHLGEQLTGFTRGDLHMDIELPADRNLTADMSHRHRGMLDKTPIFAGENRHEIIISPHTYKVNFIVRGLLAENRYEMKVTDSNVSHNFLGGLIAARKQTYHHTRTLSDVGNSRAAGEVGSSMILMQIGDDTGTSFELTNATESRSLYGNDLLQTIQTAYSAQIGPGKPYADLADMLDNQYEYDIILVYSSLGVSVEVHPWDYRPNPIDL